MVGRALVLDAVLREKLSVLIPIDEIFLIFLVFTRSVGTLDAPARGTVVACDGEAYHRPVVKGDGLLYQSLAKRAPAYHGSSVVVLDGTSQNLCGRGGNLIDKHH